MSGTVCITGMGVVCAIGTDLSAVLESLLSCRSGMSFRCTSGVF